MKLTLSIALIFTGMISAADFFGPTDPATCMPTIGLVFWNTSAGGAVPKYCSAPNVWTAFGGGAGANYGTGNGVSAANTTITLGSIPIANSVSVFSNGSILRPSLDYTVSGAALTAASYFPVGNISVNWATANVTPGGISLSGSAPNPSLRGTAIQAANATNFTVTWPTGTISGDLAIIYIGHALAVNTLGGGWAELFNQSGSNWGGAIFSKILSPAEITAGSVVVSASGGFNGVVAIATFIGNTAGIRETVASRNGTGAASVPLSTSSGIVTTDILLMFGSNRASSVDTISVGVQQQVADDGTASGALYFLSPASAGVNNVNFLYATAGAGNMQGIVVVKGI
jgi:hypothetical protein